MTVLKALRGMPETHPDTRSVVVWLAEEWDCQPNRLAKDLAKSRPQPIEVIVPNNGFVKKSQQTLKSLFAP